MPSETEEPDSTTKMVENMTEKFEDTEYESDPDVSLSLTMRRREASDDEEEGRNLEIVDRRAGIESGGESDGQGGAPAYEDELEEEEEEEEDEGEDFEEREVEEEDFEEREGEVLVQLPDSGEVAGIRRSGEEETQRLQPEEEKKETEPFAVPTAGAFYMHDDRFRDHGGARHRRTPGGRKLWESKDDRAWVHDRFEELNLQEPPQNEDRRRSKGRFRGRGKNRGGERGYAQGNRPRAYDDSNNSSHAVRGVRGRGPRRYEQAMRNNGYHFRMHNKPPLKSHDAMASSSGTKPFFHASKEQTEALGPRKHVFASSLSSASPPFYPSGSSNQDNSIIQKRVLQTGSSTQRNLPTSVSPDELVTRGKSVIEPIGQNRIYADHSLRMLTGKHLANSSPIQSSGSSSPVSATHTSHSRFPGKGLSVSGIQSYHVTPPVSHINKTTSQTLASGPQKLVQTPAQLGSKTSSQQLGSRPGSGNPSASSSPQAPSVLNVSEVGETDSPPGSSQSKTALVGKGKAGVQGSGRGSFLYGGAQVIGATGAMAVAHSDQSFPPTPALLPVMQFGSQHHGGLGVPAVGMALPGYVAQPQLGFGNSEMTWVPVLAGAAGALGAAYCSPYMAVDGGYYARPSGQTSLGVSRSNLELVRSGLSRIRPVYTPNIW
ncbi:hypothetical protein AMTR_s00142p00054380 [Amborella trichopoda]|uniref:Btz domain-containing protein n=1 Tax=Amborella trichopoda TaxID=13333 RepID=W1PG30_AMBTC|nr:hypothetical protein AMTR_s00142p00054380 [Amborella trichopoda]